MAVQIQATLAQGNIEYYETMIRNDNRYNDIQTRKIRHSKK